MNRKALKTFRIALEHTVSDVEKHMKTDRDKKAILHEIAMLGDWCYANL